MGFVLLFQLEQHYRLTVVYLKKRYLLKSRSKGRTFNPTYSNAISWHLLQWIWDRVQWYFLTILYLFLNTTKTPGWSFDEYFKWTDTSLFCSSIKKTLKPKKLILKHAAICTKAQFHHADDRKDVKKMVSVPLPEAWPECWPSWSWRSSFWSTTRCRSAWF